MFAPKFLGVKAPFVSGLFRVPRGQQGSSPGEHRGGAALSGHGAALRRSRRCSAGTPGAAGGRPEVGSENGKNQIFHRGLRELTASLMKLNVV